MNTLYVVLEEDAHDGPTVRITGRLGPYLADKRLAKWLFFLVDFDEF